jgi:hypothetical protein
MSTSIQPSHSPSEAAPIPDEDHEADLPLTMMASVVLTSLPRDATAALATAGAFEKEKGNDIPSAVNLHSEAQEFDELGQAPLPAEPGDWEVLGTSTGVTSIDGHTEITSSPENPLEPEPLVGFVIFFKRGTTYEQFLVLKMKVDNGVGRYLTFPTAGSQAYLTYQKASEREKLKKDIPEIDIIMLDEIPEGMVTELVRFTIFDSLAYCFIDIIYYEYSVKRP